MRNYRSGLSFGLFSYRKLRNQAVSKYDESGKRFHCSFDDSWKIFSDLQKNGEVQDLTMGFNRKD